MFLFPSISGALTDDLNVGVGSGGDEGEEEGGESEPGPAEHER